MPGPPIILDCDPGHDDAVAIVVAARHADLLGITTVAGNAPLERTTYNACVMRELLGISVEVHSGAERPLVAEPRHAGSVHGESGLDGADLPAPTRGADSADALGFIIETCRSTEGTWLVAVGPLTNIALVLRLAPDLHRRIGGISLMGGGTFGNREPVAEFNVWADPEAAAAVFDAGVPLVMAGLDVTYRFVTTPDVIARLQALPGTLARVLGELFVFFSANYISRHDEGLAGAAVHDPLAVLALTHPELFVRRPRNVRVETRGALTRGMTVIDQRTITDRPAANCDVLDDVDAEAAWEVVLEAVASFST
ncbi:MAG: nucleoside hydrolase [Ilumatobacteraceae bacterium]